MHTLGLKGVEEAFHEWRHCRRAKNLAMLVGCILGAKSEGWIIQNHRGAVMPVEAMTASERVSDSQSAHGFVKFRSITQ